MSDLHIDPWVTARKAELEAARAAFEARPDFSALVSEAARRGYRRISLYEQIEKTSDAYEWRGGVWIKDGFSGSPRGDRG